MTGLRLGIVVTNRGSRLVLANHSFGVENLDVDRQESAEPVPAVAIAPYILIESVISIRACCHQKDLIYSTVVRTPLDAPDANLMMPFSAIQTHPALGIVIAYRCSY